MHYFLRKINKIGATRYQILRLKCTKFDFCWGSAPDPLAVFKGPTSKGREGNGRGEEEKQWEREGREGRVGEGGREEERARETKAFEHLTHFAFQTLAALKSVQNELQESCMLLHIFLLCDSTLTKSVYSKVKIIWLVLLSCPRHCVSCLFKCPFMHAL